jgi:hypothetical protein
MSVEATAEWCNIIDKSELDERFKDNLIVKVDKDGWIAVRKNSNHIWVYASYCTIPDECGDVFYVFAPFKSPEYAQGY